MAEELKPCPFCGCSMRLESNRDWHRIVGDHALECAFTDSETMVVPATKEQRDIAVSDWNARAVPAGHVVVSEGLLRKWLELMEHGDYREGHCMCGSSVDGHGIGDGHAPVDAGEYYAGQVMEELRALLSEQA
ncbi:TPA: Lar family restriction alleviation protein [Pseudomonas aeruginosa]|uniref:Lar family restriction alleviation protein n=1 Tax=Pseudomonas aeruginosa TaxID=287 RepID=UPI000694C383|nr:Lar family restriction alleviation protein [Pseudomonas aeruginosa]